MVLITHLVGVDPVVDGPRGLEILEHALLQLLRETMDAYEVFQVLHARVIQRPARVHALDDGRHVSEHHCVHESWNSQSQEETYTGVSIARAQRSGSSYGRVSRLTASAVLTNRILR